MYYFIIYYNTMLSLHENVSPALLEQIRACESGALLLF